MKPRVLVLLGASLLVAWPALGGASSVPPVSPGLALPGACLMWWICSRHKDKPIGGWLLYFYIQLYGSVLFGWIFIFPTLKNYNPAIWHNKTLYALWLIALFPVQFLLIVRIFLASLLLQRLEWKWAQLLMVSLALDFSFAVLALFINDQYFPGNNVFRYVTILYATVWLLYFWNSVRARAVFRDHNWDAVAARLGYRAAPATLALYSYCNRCGLKVLDSAAVCRGCGAEAPRPQVAGLAPLESAPEAAMGTVTAASVSLEAATPTTLETVRKRRGWCTPQTAISAAAGLYCAAILAALVLHLQVRTERKIAKNVSAVESKLADLVFKRKERCPRLLELLKWPNGASDGGADGFIRRTAELAPLLNDELARGKLVQADATNLLANLPVGNPNRTKTSLLARAAEQDVDLYESFQQEVSLADRAQLRSGAERAKFVDSELKALREQENEDLARRNDTLDQLK